MRDRQVQILFFEKYGLMVDCSKLTERQISRFLDIYPRPKISDYETLGEFFNAAFGKGAHLPVATPEYERLSAQTPLESVQCPSLYQGLVRELRVRWYKSEDDLKALKAKESVSQESMKAAHQVEVKNAEDAAYVRGLLDAEKVFRRKMLVEANAALEEVSDQLHDYTNGIKDDLEMCIKNLESSASDGSVGAYNLIIELSKKFAMRVKRSRDLQPTR